MAGYFTMEIEVDRGQISSESPSSPLPRTGSIRGTPPAEQSFIADPKDISIEEQQVEGNSVSVSKAVGSARFTTHCSIAREFSDGVNVLWR